MWWESKKRNINENVHYRDKVSLRSVPLGTAISNISERSNAALRVLTVHWCGKEHPVSLKTDQRIRPRIKVPSEFYRSTLTYARRYLRSFSPCSQLRDLSTLLFSCFNSASLSFRSRLSSLAFLDRLPTLVCHQSYILEMFFLFRTF